MSERFIVDSNVGKLGKWLRIMGYDTLFFRATDDSQMIGIALADGRTLLTKDTQIMKRGVITSGKVRAIMIDDDDPAEQLRQVVKALHLERHLSPFSLCLMCNQALIPRVREEVQSLVPAYVFQTQTQYMQCPTCQRVYWRGTHWQAMSRMLNTLTKEGCLPMPSF